MSLGDTPLSSSGAIALEARGITKEFGATKALTDVDFVIRAGERVAIMGENGAGKSTLMKVFAGVHAPTRGSMTLGGEPYAPRTPLDAIAAGVTTVYQEPSAFGHLSVLENLFMGRQKTNRLGIIDRAGMQKEAVELLESLGIRPSLLSRQMRTLSLAEQQQVLIARAVTREAKMLILDEPTSILTNAESDRLFTLIDQLAEAGTAIGYITHRFDELERVADRFVVLRNGQNAGEVAHADRKLILEMMGSAQAAQNAGSAENAGSEQNGPDRAGVADDAEVVLDVRNLTSPGAFSDISLQIRSGEIVGLYGLVGAGRTEVALALFGELPIESGTIRYLGREFVPKSSRQALHDGIAYLPEDRKSQGIFPYMTVGQNMVSAMLSRLTRGGFMNGRKEREVVRRSVEQLSVKTSGISAPITALSGGNQQKVLLARLIATQPRLLMLDEPTRGIDVGTKEEIHKDIRRLADEGLAVLVISSELPELLALADTVHVLHEGTHSAEFTRSEVTEKAVLAAAVGLES